MCMYSQLCVTKNYVLVELHLLIVETLYVYMYLLVSCPTQWERSALHSASIGGQTEVVKMLLQTGLYINDQDQVGPRMHNLLLCDC